jgi:hypothetical protein
LEIPSEAAKSQVLPFEIVGFRNLRDSKGRWVGPGQTIIPGQVYDVPNTFVIGYADIELLAV